MPCGLLIFGLGLGSPILMANHEWGWGFLFLLGCVLSGIGLFKISKADDALKILKRNGQTVSCKEYSPIKERLAKGWSWGEDPPQR